MSQIKGTVSAGGVIMNDYTFRVEDITGGHRLTIKRGSDTQVMDIMDHDLAVGGTEGQVISFDAEGKPVAVDLPPAVKTVNGATPDANGNVEVQGGADLSALLETTYTDTLTWDGKTKIEFTEEPTPDGDGYEAYRVVFYYLGNVDKELIKGANAEVTAFTAQGPVTASGELDLVDSTDDPSLPDNVYFFGLAELGMPVYVTTEENAVIDMDGLEIVLPKIGAYSMHLGFIAFDSDMNVTHDVVLQGVESVKAASAIFPVQTIKPELLPEGGSLFTFTLTNVSFNSPTESTWTCNKSPEEIFAAAVAGKTLVARMKMNMGDETLGVTLVRQTSNVGAVSAQTADGTNSDVVIQIVEYNAHTNEDGTFSPVISGFWEYSTSNGLVCKYYND